MNSAEKLGCECILKRIPLCDLMSLKDTVAKRKVTAENANDAIKVILTYSESSTELLRRKKIRREVMLQYLMDENIPVSVNADKNQLIQKTLQYWGAAVINAAPKLQMSAGDVNQNTSSSKTDNAHRSFATQSHVAGSGPSLGRQADVSVPGNQNPTMRDYELLVNQRSETAWGDQFQAVQYKTPVPIQIHIHQEQNYLTPTSSSALPTSQHTCMNTDHQTLGETFVSWFYKILNSHNPSLNLTPEDFGPHHFWNDVRFHLIMVAPSKSSEVYEGAETVSQRLLALVRHERLLFNPNTTSEGIQVKSDRHGLLVILVCGTVHRENDCLGVFQQMFGLIGDPRFDNNWKIKITRLGVQSTQVTSIPKLQDSDNSDMLSEVLMEH